MAGDVAAEQKAHCALWRRRASPDGKPTRTPSDVHSRVDRRGNPHPTPRAMSLSAGGVP